MKVERMTMKLTLNKSYFVLEATYSEFHSK
jgi:hypothetical protein